MKKIIVIMIAILLTGCTADCNLTINKDLSMSESVEVLNKTSIIEEGYDLPRTGIMSRINSYYDTDYFDDYSYDLVLEDINSGAIFERKYDTILTYNDSFFLNWLFDDIDILQTDKLITMTFHLSESSVFESDPLDSDFVFNYVNINIKNPYKITAGNYDSINDDTLTWNYSSSNLKDELTFTFDTSILTNGTIVSNPVSINYTTVAVTQKDNFNMLYILIPIFGIILLGTGIVYIIYKKKNDV